MVGRLGQTADASVVPDAGHWVDHCLERCRESGRDCHPSASEAARELRASETKLYLRQRDEPQRAACLAAADELWAALPAEDAPQSAVLEPARYAEARKEPVLAQLQGRSVQESRALLVLQLLADAEQGLPALQRGPARPEVRWVPMASRAQAQQQLWAVPLPVHELAQAHGVLPVSLQRVPARRPPVLAQVSPQASQVPSPPLRLPLLPPQRLATGGGLFRRLQRGWSSSASFSRLRQSPAKDQ